MCIYIYMYIYCNMCNQIEHYDVIPSPPDAKDITAPKVTKDMQSSALQVQVMFGRSFSSSKPA